MEKKASTFTNMILSLLVVTLASGLTLGYVNDITIEPKAKAKLERKTKAIKLVLKEFNSNPLEEMMVLSPGETLDSVELYPVYYNSKFIGAAVTGYSEKGYSGLVKLLVGFNNDGSINNIAVLDQKETPGLGTKMKNNSFLEQFRDKHPHTFKLTVSKDGGDIDAITGATISTRAFGESVEMAFRVFMTHKNQFYKNSN